MSATLELYDGTTTLDFLGSVYKATTPVEFGPPPAKPAIAGIALRGLRYSPRNVSFGLTIIGTSVSNLETQIRNLDTMLATAKERQSVDEGTIVVLKIQVGNTDASDISYRVLMGQLALPTNVLDEPGLSSGYATIRARLTLLVEPLGRLAQVTPSTDTLENEQDGANLNYMDLNSITGDEAARMQLKIHDANNGGANAWSGSTTMWVGVRKGSRQSDTLFFQGEDATKVAGTNPATGANAADVVFTSSNSAPANSSAASAGQFEWTNSTGSAQTGLYTTRVSLGYYRIDIAGGSLPRGLFRVLARVQRDEGGDVTLGNDDIRFATGWSFGSTSYTPVAADDVAINVAKNTWATLDLGELVIPPTSIPDSFTAPTLQIRIHMVLNTEGTGWGMTTINSLVRSRLDYVQLLPLDEGAAIISSVGTSDRVLIDSVSDRPGVYLLNTSNVVQSYATFTGGPFKLGPEDTRIYVLRDDTGDPSTVQFVLTPTYIPQVVGL